MRRVAALLAAVLALGSSAIAEGCGGGGAEPGAPDGATLILDFTPNAAHSGIYTALERGYYSDAGVELTVRAPGASTDAPKLLEANQGDFAVLDIHDLALARVHGADLVAVMPIVQRPLGSIIARADRGIDGPRDLGGKTVGVTGLPSDDAVVDSEVRADGGDPEAVKRVTIGFNAVADLAAGKVDAATGFWNVEGVALERQGVPVKIFKVDDFGAPSYPELVLATSRHTLIQDPGLVDAVVEATSDGYESVSQHSSWGVNDLLAGVPALDRGELTAQLEALRRALIPAPFDYGTLLKWTAWDVRNGVLEQPLWIAAGFPSLDSRLGGLSY